ncbi:Sulfate/thiosulfate import ATP-binding protein CysA [Calidithermus terrae]|uniref:Sulfate/thiosulfate import ATP-binding protein CysA n=1 Tax=Calidithermus terrae TaxID=1408545 RepID=A0A399ELH1_9DEIN|nr:sulfate ABC transporter ATP-binding protein [Calidithermus terrae]RIH84240.1 Sulfate/thiosulfate import ATP-binding protein CysA [Calidithermus terrae]
MNISIENLSKRFGNFTALEGVNLSIKSGELVALLGPSGSGKTTLLRVIAGLETPDTGLIWFDDEDATLRPPGERRVGFVFQHYALFRHMTVFENVAFGLQVRPRVSRPGKRELASRVHELLRLVQLEWAAQRYPSQLSGGQRQRVALARALAVEPKVLLLDEPFGALDAKVREELRRWLRKLHDEIGLTSVFVTHDQEEALEIAHRVVVFNRGRIEQVGTPEEVYDHPATPFVYHFLGRSNALAGGFVRPHELEVSPRPAEGYRPGVLKHLRLVGAVARLEVESAESGGLLEIELPRALLPALGLQEGSLLYYKPQRLRQFAEVES